VILLDGREKLRRRIIVRQVSAHLLDLFLVIAPGQAPAQRPPLDLGWDYLGIDQLARPTGTLQVEWKRDFPLQEWGIKNLQLEPMPETEGTEFKPEHPMGAVYPSLSEKLIQHITVPVRLR
jgi:hypothetical protein